MYIPPPQPTIETVTVDGISVRHTIPVKLGFGFALVFVNESARSDVLTYLRIMACLSGFGYECFEVRSPDISTWLKNFVDKVIIVSQYSPGIPTLDIVKLHQKMIAGYVCLYHAPATGLSFNYLESIQYEVGIKKPSCPVLAMRDGGTMNAVDGGIESVVRRWLSEKFSSDFF